MRGPIFLGDEVTAAGWRLAGVAVRTPSRSDAGAALEDAREQASLVLVSAAVAVHIAHDEMRAALTALQPLVLIVPDAQGEIGRPDLAARLRAQLGLEA